MRPEIRQKCHTVINHGIIIMIMIIFVFLLHYRPEKRIFFHCFFFVFIYEEQLLIKYQNIQRNSSCSIIHCWSLCSAWSNKISKMNGGSVEFDSVLLEKVTIFLREFSMLIFIMNRIYKLYIYQSVEQVNTPRLYSGDMIRKSCAQK